jgi:ribosome recycling factor
MFNFNELKEKTKSIEEWLHKELSVIRTGRATPIVLDSLLIEAYGSKMGIKELGTITVEDAKSVRIEPWDSSLIKSIEKAIIASNLGLSVAPFERGLRLIFPQLTSERREQLAKVVGQKLEDARISLRGLRDKTWAEIQEKEKKGGMGEDDKFRLKDEMQRIIDDTGSKLEEMASKKESEIKS